MRHLIAILLQNEAGALTRVTGLISTRGYNIESLSVAPTNDPTVSRVTLVTIGSDHVIAQINAQLLKLVDVVAVEDMTSGDHLARELLLIKLQIAPDQVEAVGALLRRDRRAGAVVEPVELHRGTHEHGDRNRRVHRQRRRIRRNRRGGAQRRLGHLPLEPATARRQMSPRTLQIEDFRVMPEIEVTPEHAADPNTRRVGILVGVVGIFLSVVTIASHRAHTQAVIHRTESNDQWAFYQAKKIRENTSEVALTLLESLAVGTREGRGADAQARSRAR